MTVLFSYGVAERFAELPERVKRKAAHSIGLMISHPQMYPIRRRGLMKGYRYFVAASFLFYYKHTTTEIRMSAIIPGVMKRA